MRMETGILSKRQSQDNGAQASDWLPSKPVLAPITATDRPLH